MWINSQTGPVNLYDNKNYPQFQGKFTKKDNFIHSKQKAQIERV